MMFASRCVRSSTTTFSTFKVSGRRLKTLPWKLLEQRREIVNPLSELFDISADAADIFVLPHIVLIKLIDLLLEVRNRSFVEPEVLLKVFANALVMLHVTQL
ncbi:hypothetical protein [Celeribacter halophilus]|uniref:hypothetical protein n=1 Tax=Celeribacter halophilus TaxID=576117 RepID=UPI003A8F6533